MSGSCFPLPLFLLTFLAACSARRLNPIIDSEDVCNMCQVPVRPTNILESLQLTDENTVYFHLEMRPCRGSEDQDEDLYFRIRSFYVDCVGHSASDVKMSSWENYGLIHTMNWRMRRWRILETTLFSIVIFA